MLKRFRGTGESGCRCEVTLEDATLHVDATDCDGDGDLVDHPGCRRTTIDALGRNRAERIRVETDGLVRWYGFEGTELLHSAGRFARRIESRAERLAATARRDPIEAATEATSRSGLAQRVAERTGLARYADEDASYRDLLGPLEGPAIAASRLDLSVPSDAVLRTARVVDSGASVRVYDRDADVPMYHLEPIEWTLDADAAETLERAAEHMVDSGPEGEILSPLAAVRRVAGPDCPVDTLGTVLEKHTRGYGVFDDLFSDEAVSEVFVNAPADANPLYVRVGDTEMRTNVWLTERGAAGFAAALRTRSGRAFSRASPTIDTALTDVGSATAVRVSGLCEPASDGLAFALRAEGTDSWRLSTLVELGTLSPPAAGLLSVAMSRGGALLVAGPRGAGKTTTAAALLWELGQGTRLLAIEDTPELPIEALQSAGRDAQRVEAAAGFDAEIDPATALHTALRFGDGALAVGEVRGEEAAVLYEAMRVGAASDTVIGTIHGRGYEGVKERVVSDLGVPASSFGATDLLVTQAPSPDGKRVTAIEEVTESGGSTLYEYQDGDLHPTPRIERGNSRVVAALARPDETYEDVLAAIEDRAATLRPSGLRSATQPAVVAGPDQSGPDSSGRATHAAVHSTGQGSPNTTMGGQ